MSQDALGAKGVHGSRSLCDIQMGVHQRLLNTKMSLKKLLTCRLLKASRPFTGMSGLFYPGSPFPKVSGLGVLGAPCRDLPPELGEKGWRPLAGCTWHGQDLSSPEACWQQMLSWRRSPSGLLGSQLFLLGLACVDLHLPAVLGFSRSQRSLFNSASFKIEN